MHVHRARADVMLLAPDFLEQLLAIVGAAGMGEEKFQQAEFGRGQSQFLVAKGRAVGGPVQREGSQPQ